MLASVAYFHAKLSASVAHGDSSVAKSSVFHLGKEGKEGKEERKRGRKERVSEVISIQFKSRTRTRTKNKTGQDRTGQDRRQKNQSVRGRFEVCRG